VNQYFQLNRSHDESNNYVLEEVHQMIRYWIIAPYDSREKEIFKKVWNYDCQQGSIAIGWAPVGDLTGLSRSNIEKKYEEVYGDKYTSYINILWRFYNEISINDIIIARKGTKRIVGIGKVIERAFHSVEEGKKRVAHLTDNYYPNFIRVNWEKLEEITFEKIIFSFLTMYNIEEDKYQNLLEGVGIEEKPEFESQEYPEFVLEKYLEEFIVSNFDSIFKGKIELYKDDEGYPSRQYPTGVGPIDILAKNVENGNFLVIELKKGRESDKVVGQILRYMGWIKENLCTKDQEVEGLIICKDKELRLEYALKPVNNVKIKLYNVNFELVDG
jgi:restriction system protein